MKTDKELIMMALNSMHPIRNKKVRREFVSIYNDVFTICDMGLSIEKREELEEKYKNVS